MVRNRVHVSLCLSLYSTYKQAQEQGKIFINLAVCPEVTSFYDENAGVAEA